ncbi:TonB-dependent receptor [Lentisalinibacter sediminis]|uniref:TonB-dependent receptor n=1 Tax=Lentisalinibacter sediminis TaxID=2992237 RepID=UPI0038702AED
MPNIDSPSRAPWLWRNIVRAWVAALLIVMVPVAGFAQETTSNIRGKVLDENGAPVAGETVTIEDMRSGVSRTLTTDASGLFLATRLLPGGPYQISVRGQSTEVPSISLGDTYSLTVGLRSEAAMEEIVVTGQALQFVDVASGPAATFNVADLESAVSFSRDISEVYGIDPRIMIDQDEDGFGVNCAGKHPRFNNITLDGISQTDRFGLNENGYSTAVGMPFPYDAIEQIAVELAPFDVTYGGFSACNINAVTKSGTNEWQVGAFYEFSNDSLRGDTIGDTTIGGTPGYDKTYIGFDLGGPIIKDRLFIFAAYEESEEPRFLARGFDGSGNGEERPWLSQADYNRIRDIAQNVYGYDPGGQPTDGVQEAEKYMVRLDWNINDRHNAALIYNYFDGFQDRDSDGDDNEFEFANHFYVKGAEFETYTAKLWSQWTDNLSTEIFYSTSEMNDSQVTVGPKEFADMQISLGAFPNVDTVYLGADDSRQANALGTESTYLRLAGNYFIGDHVITAGYDREELEIFNIFVQHSNGGEYDYFDSSLSNDPACAALTAQERFDDVLGIGCQPSGIDRFELGRPSRIYYGSGGGTNNPNDAAANFSNVLNALYIQDEIFFDDYGLTITAGLRYEWFTSDDRPNFNPTFSEIYGIRNDANIDGLDLIMPRLGFTWDVREDLTLRGGVGRYSGGNPNVWISNAWSNDGLTNAQFQFNYFDSATVLPGFVDSLQLSGEGRPGFDVPQEMVDAVLAVTPSDAVDSNLVILDPDYDQPNEWKWAFGGTWDTPWYDIQMDFDFLYTRGDDSAYYVDLSQEIVGTTTLGIPVYDYVDRNGDGEVEEDNLMLTNSDETTTSKTISVILRKDFDFGLDVLFGYAWTEAEDVSPMTSATAGSNFGNTALIDLNNPVAATSNYVIPQRYTLRLNYANAFFGDNLTEVTLYGFVNKGQPQSYGMSSQPFEGDNDFARHLLYIPAGPTDPNVVFGPDFDQEAFFNWVAERGLAPGLTERNDFHTGWSTRFDLRVSQEVSLPAGFRGQAYLKIYNLGNLLNDDWGEIVDAQFTTPGIVGLGYEIDEDNEVPGIDAQGRLVYGSFSDESIERTYINRSLWEARIGIDIKFGGD